jgi:glycosyltransferase involved in cell wall biosynthesis
MGKKSTHAAAAKKTTIQNYKPFVSICTPTFNRRPFIENMFRCFRNQDYPKDRMEWIIVDDGTDKIGDLIEKANIPEIKYFQMDRKMLLGEKRNFMHSKAKGSIIVYMDDDDYYPPERVSHAVQKLMGNKEALCAGSSEMYIYFKHINKMYQCGPYGPNHATAGTFAFKAQLLKETRYDDGAALAEEKSFLKNYTIPFVQLDPMKTILVFSHMHNTYDKKKMLDNPHPDYFKESAKRVRDFIRNSNEKEIMQFFLKDIDDLLDKYEDGQPKMKPDVLEQTAKIEAERKKMVEEETKKLQAQMHTGIFMNEPDKPPVELSPNQVMDYINQLKGEVDRLKKNSEELTQMNLGLQTKLMKLEMEKMRAGIAKPAAAAPVPAPSTEKNVETISVSEVNDQL